MPDRKETREKKNIPIVHIVLKDDDQTYPATVCDISPGGMSVKAGHVFPTYKVIDVIFKIHQARVSVKGSVRWVNESRGDTENEIGLTLLNPPNEYLDHFADYLRK